MENFILVEDNKEQKESVKKKGQIRFFAAVFLVSTGIILVAVMLGRPFWKSNANNLAQINSEPIESGQYQAVHLENGEVYFGRLKIEEKWGILSDVYYPSNQDKLASGIKGVQLIKAGKEVYGPEDKLIIQLDKILYWQNIRPDSDLVKAIENYKMINN